MTCLKQLTLFLALLFLKIVNGQDHTVAEPFQEILQACPESCPWNSQQFNATEASSDWCPQVNFTEPSYRIKLPKCKNVTVKSSDFYIGESNELVLKINGMEIYPDYRLTNDNTTAAICYSLSPQLQNCNLKLLDRRLYAYSEQMMILHNCKTQELIALADFYELSGNKGIVGCNESLGYYTELQFRCHYVHLAPAEYELLDDNTTIRMLPSNRTVYRAFYGPSENSSNIRMCFPLNAAMTKCKKYTFSPHEYSQETDYKIYVSRGKKHIDLGDYQIDFSTGELLICSFEDEHMRYFDFYYYCYIIQILSAALIVLAIIFHLIFPEINKHAKPLLCQMLSMAMFYIVGTYRFLCYPETKAGCYIVFGFGYFSAFTSFFWLNVLSFDLWSIFANLPTSSVQLCTNMCNKKPKFLLYCVYAYLIPLVMTILCILLETQPSMQDAVNIHPNLRLECWFSNAKSYNIFYFGPVFFLLCINAVLFLMTVLNLRRASDGDKTVNKERNKQLLFVCIKIFVITGLCWNIQFISNLTTVRAIKIVAFIATSIQGILLFIIYICKPSTYKIIKRKLRSIMPSRSDDATNTNSSKDQGPNRSSSSRVSMESVINDDNSIQENATGNNQNGQIEDQTTSL